MYQITYTGDGENTEFNFGAECKWFQTDDIKVAVGTVPLAPSQYAVQTAAVEPEYETEEQRRANSMGIAANYGGKIIFAAPPAPGANIGIFRKIALDRQIRYQLTANITAGQLNTDFDFITEYLRDLAELDVDMTAIQNLMVQVHALQPQIDNLDVLHPSDLDPLLADIEDLLEQIAALPDH
ncbi:MAG: hypothetical protein LBL21_05310, partial [Rickettsiales bacterium]|nr:hypothetical protein [Rickettsiales bacterium]